jgi:peroxiredoxin
MSLRVGDPIPETSFGVMRTDGPGQLLARDLFPGRTVVLFGVPGAFTPTCSDDHLPGFLARADDFSAAGADVVACVAVNDTWVLHAWGRQRGVGEHVRLLADGNGDFARAAGVDVDLSQFGMGTRLRRFAAIVEDGTVRHVAVEPGPGVSVSGAEPTLAALRAG